MSALRQTLLISPTDNFSFLQTKKNPRCLWENSADL